MIIRFNLNNSPLKKINMIIRFNLNNSSLKKINMIIRFNLSSENGWQAMNTSIHPCKVFCQY